MQAALTSSLFHAHAYIAPRTPGTCSRQSAAAAAVAAYAASAYQIDHGRLSNVKGCDNNLFKD
jgi:hypothetical protein